MKNSVRLIHNNRLSSALNTLNKCDINPKNKACILDFDEFLSAKGFSDARRSKYLRYLRVIAQLTSKDFKDLSKSDVINIISQVNERGWAEWTRVTVFILFKSFMKWLLGNSKFYPECVEWIETNVKNKTNVCRKDILEPEEVNKLIRSCNNDRDRLLISLLWESGCRIGEVLNLKIEDLHFDKDKGAIIEVDGKTGKRTLRLIECVHYLKTYLQNHPKPERGTYLFFNRCKNLAVEYDAVRAQLRKIALRAGVKKPLNPHNFRHSRATYIAQYWTESQMRKWFGWSNSSNMPSVYVHLTTRDLDDAVFEMYGIKNEAKQKELMTSCEACGKLTPKQLMFCSYCSQPLDKRMIQESDLIRLKQEVMQMVMNSINSKA